MKSDTLGEARKVVPARLWHLTLSGVICKLVVEGSAKQLEINQLRSELLDVTRAFIDVMGTFRDDRDMLIAGHRVEKWEALADRLKPKETDA